MRKILVSLSLVILLLSACSSEEPLTSGTVVNKGFDEAHWEGGWDYRTVQKCGYHTRWDGEYLYECWTETESYWDEDDRWVDDSYGLQLKGCEINDKGENKCRTSWLTVPESVWDEYEVGEIYPKPR